MWPDAKAGAEQDTRMEVKPYGVFAPDPYVSTVRGFRVLHPFDVAASGKR
jgi:hypothetical protein